MCEHKEDTGTWQREPKLCKNASMCSSASSSMCLVSAGQGMASIMEGGQVIPVHEKNKCHRKTTIGQSCSSQIFWRTILRCQFLRLHTLFQAYEERSPSHNMVYQQGVGRDVVRQGYPWQISGQWSLCRDDARQLHGKPRFEGDIPPFHARQGTEREGTSNHRRSPSTIIAMAERQQQHT